MKAQEHLYYKLRIGYLAVAGLGLFVTCFFMKDWHNILAFSFVGVISEKWAHEVFQEYQNKKKKTQFVIQSTELSIAKNLDEKEQFINK